MWHKRRQILLSLPLLWGEGTCTIPTLQQALQPRLLAHGGGICPQSCFPARAASSMNTFHIVEDKQTQEQPWGAETGTGGRRAAGEDPLAQPAPQSSGGLCQSIDSPGRCFQGVGNTFPALHMRPDRDSPGAGLCASWVPQVFFPTVSHLYEKVIFSTPHRKYCLERGFWSIRWRFLPSASTDLQPGAAVTRCGCMSNPPPHPPLSTQAPWASSAEKISAPKRLSCLRNTFLYVQPLSA